MMTAENLIFDRKKTSQSSFSVVIEDCDIKAALQCGYM